MPCPICYCQSHNPLVRTVKQCAWHYIVVYRLIFLYFCGDGRCDRKQRKEKHIKEIFIKLSGYVGKCTRNTCGWSVAAYHLNLDLFFILGGLGYLFHLLESIMPLYESIMAMFSDITRGHGVKDKFHARFLTGQLISNEINVLHMKSTSEKVMTWFSK